MLDTRREVGVVSIAANTLVWRPVQFLGSKVRSLDFISDAVASLGDSPLTVWDPFCGSSVVSQRFASEGHRVWSSDALASSATFGAALLGVGRQQGCTTELFNLAQDMVKDTANRDSPEWTPWVESEQTLLADANGPGLLLLGTKIPQRWRSSGATPALIDLFATIDEAARTRTESSAGLVSTAYAGTYFGIGQSLSLERLREAIDRVSPLADPSARWTRSALLTALCHAASAAVFSPGKHFAQAHRVRADKDLTFHERRVMQDRSVDVTATFLRAVQEIDCVAAGLSGDHWAEHRLVGEVPADLLRIRDVDVVYADPPYTAQQYSRFYHLLETLVIGVPPVLQRVKGQVTRGLYPERRFLSPFSSRREAPGAFRSLIRNTHAAGAHIMISYSATRGGSTGNARIVSLDQVEQWVRDAYGVSDVTVQELSHRYRQFNSGALEVEGRDDPEFLVLGRAGAR